MTASPKNRDDKLSHSIGYNLASIAVFVFLAAVGAAYLIDRLNKGAIPPPPSLADTDALTQTIAGRDLAIPRNWFRFGEQIRAGFTDQIDLRIAFPLAGGTSSLVDVTLVPRSRARTSAALLDSVYIRQFAEGTLSSTTGLVGKKLQGSAAVEGETVWYDAISLQPFVAKCMAPITENGASQCVRTVHLPSGIAAVYSFDATILSSWRQFDAELEKWLSPIGAL
jgi:hypothetical protein